MTRTLKFPSSLPPPTSFEKVGEYLESATGYKSSIRYPVETFQEFLERYGHNFQPGGVFIHTESPLPVGAFLQMEITLKNGGFILKAEGQVAWARRPEGSDQNLPPGMGVKFLEIQGESQSVLDAIIAGSKK